MGHKKGILQYCFVQPICALATFVMQLNGIYKEGAFRYNVGYPYVAILRSLSQTWAIYCLVLFYVALKGQNHESDGYKKFTRLKPVNKFLCVKGVVFFTYWQSVLIAAFVWLGKIFVPFSFVIGWIRAKGQWSEDEIAVGLQNFIICIEMCLAAIAHIFAFEIDDFQQCEYEQVMAPHRIMIDVANVADIVGDARKTLRSSANDMLLGNKNKTNKGSKIIPRRISSSPNLQSLAYFPNYDSLASFQRTLHPNQLTANEQVGYTSSTTTLSKKKKKKKSSRRLARSATPKVKVDNDLGPQLSGDKAL
ncbi:transmembrane protein [Reticulomyxa filosa]|uniref:Transmembrane protein n=1 Tax=Reticulomyxa filosa TaxID=46433 RepID=X6P2W1_RETFI|nr:transmembrane protein [Reticulomyxa filosa]|eukprot:ETO31892.1 transmembrane protein [Reticulomyxa filosa]